VAARDKPRKKDIDRILYARGQEELIDSDELYALFQTLSPERVSALRQAIREQSWHLMDEQAREAFLLSWLPESEFVDCYDLLADFRFGGYRFSATLSATSTMRTGCRSESTCSAKAIPQPLPP
jgi:hypothetical protein